MSQKKLLYDYLDGALSSDAEQELFSELASDSSLRSDLNSFRKLDEMTHDDMKSIVTPSAATNEVFSRLGFKIPSSGYTPNKASSFSALRKKYGYIALLLLLFGFIGVGSYIAFNYNQLKSNLEASKLELFKMNKSNAMLSQQLDEISELNIAQKEHYEKQIAFLSSTAISSDSRNSINAADEYSSGSHSVSPQSMFDFIDENVLIENTQSIASSRDNRNRIISTQKAFFGGGDTELMIMPIIRNSSDAFKFEQIDLSEVQTLLAGSDSRIAPQKYMIFVEGYTSLADNTNISNTERAMTLNNTAFGLSYKLSPSHAFGIVLGFENYPQVFNRKVEGLDVVQTQNPVLFYYGVNYRFSPKDWLLKDIVYPYMNVFTGATSIGAIMRSQAGIEWKVYANFAIYAGIDYNLLLYNYDSVIYDTQKTGLKSGISIGF